MENELRVGKGREGHQEGILGKAGILTGTSLTSKGELLKEDAKKAELFDAYLVFTYTQVTVKIHRNRKREGRDADHKSSQMPPLFKSARREEPAKRISKLLAILFAHFWMTGKVPEDRRKITAYVPFRELVTNIFPSTLFNVKCM